MKFDDILKLEDKTMIPEIRGRVVRVYEAQRPTQKQDKAGIHKQTVAIQNDAGTNLNLDILSNDKHMPFSAEGEEWVFKSMPDDRNGGELSGIRASVWINDKQEEVFSIDVGRNAHLYAVVGMKIATRFDPTTRHEAEFYVGILSAIEDKMAAGELHDKLMEHPQALIAMATTIYIECGKNGIKTRWMQEQLRQLGTYPAQAAAMATQKPQERAESAERYQERQPDTGPCREVEKVRQEVADAKQARTQEEAARPDPARAPQVDPNGAEDPEQQIALMAYGGIPREKILSAIEAVYKDANPNYEKVMDFLFGFLATDNYEMRHMHAAYDKARMKIKENADGAKVGNELVCKSITLGWSRFKEMLDAARAEDRPAPPSIGSNEDLENLPPLT